MGLDLFPGQIELIKDWEASGKPNALFCVGRRSGKTTIAAAAALFNATDPWYAEHLPPGAFRDVVVVANSLDQANFFIREVRRQLNGPRVDPRIYSAVNWDACRVDLISIGEGVSVRAMPLSSRSTRGPACSMLIFDESGHFQAGGEGVGEGNEVYQALAPTVVQFGNRGHILFTSTPKLRMGLFYEQYRNGVEGKDLDLYVAQRATWDVRPEPEFTRPTLERKFPGRPQWVATEYGADFASAEGAFLDPEDIYGCQRSTGTIPPNSDLTYKCAIDPAFQKDAFAMAIAHKERDTVVVDGVWAWNRAGFENTLDQVVAICRRYGVKQVRTDQFSSQSVLEGLRTRRVECDVVAWNNAGKFEAFTRLKAGLATRQVSLPLDEALVMELMNLRASSTISGLVRIEAGSGHDDRATVLAALMDLLESEYGPIVLTHQDYHAMPESPFEAMGAFVPD